MKNSRLALLLSILLVLPAVACSGSSTATGTAPSDGFPAPSSDFVFNVAAQVLRQQGLSPSMEDSSRQTWTVVTHWRMTPAPFSGQGYRERATVKIMDVPGYPGNYFTETQVVRQANMNIKAPSNMMVANWGNEERNGERELAINRLIEIHFLTGDVSTSFRDRHSMPSQTPYRIDSSTIPCPDASPPPEKTYP